MASQTDAELKKLTEQFVCVRRVQMGGVDLSVFQFDPFLSWASARPLSIGILGGCCLTLATHSTDHDMVQRLLAARSGGSGGR